MPADWLRRSVTKTDERLPFIGFRQWHRITAHLFKGSRSELATARIRLHFQQV
jgi:hypothetical protein